MHWLTPLAPYHCPLSNVHTLLTPCSLLLAPGPVHHAPRATEAARDVAMTWWLEISRQRKSTINRSKYSQWRSLDSSDRADNYNLRDKIISVF
jgi:hypothetical protein